MNSYPRTSFFISFTWTKVEVSDSACLGTIKRHVQNTGPSVSKRMDPATQSALFYVITFFACKPLKQVLTSTCAV